MNVMAVEYASLLTKNLPKVIHSEGQNEDYISILEALERRSDSLTPAEKEFAELLTLLIEDFEDKNYVLLKGTPLEVITELMEANNLRQKDLAPIFGAESIVSEVLNGKRELNINHIKKLSERFNVSPELFL